MGRLPSGASVKGPESHRLSDEGLWTPAQLGTLVSLQMAAGRHRCNLQRVLCNAVPLIRSTTRAVIDGNETPVRL